MSDPLDADPATIPPLRSRRAVIAGALGGVAGLLAGKLGRPDPASAAAGGTLIIGSQANNAGTANTQLITNSDTVAFKLLQNSPNTALMGYVTTTANAGGPRGVYGRVDAPNGDGIQARNAGTAGSGAAIRAFGGANDGLVATTNNGAKAAVVATNTDPSGGGAAVQADGGSNDGVRATTTTGVGVHSTSSSGPGVVGLSDSNVGLYGQSRTNLGVYGFATLSGVGVYGSSTFGGTGVYGFSGSGYALYGYGNGGVSGSFSKASGTFKIDHPLDPAHKYLQHSFVESPDMKNVYDGLITLDAAGQATVKLPAYFEALNRDLRYQLTALGSGAPELHVKTKLAKGRFTIAGGNPGQEVCWQVTGIRQDAWAKAHPVVVESDKPENQDGLYLHPKEHGQPESKGVDHAERKAMQERSAPPEN